VAKIQPPNLRESEVWKSIFRPGSIYRKGYKDTSRDRALATMNNVLWHLHPTKVKRHGLKLTYTFCLGGLSFFLFILLTITGIFLMFFYRPTAAAAWGDIETLQTQIAFGLLVRNMHRWGAHLMVISVFLHMARVFYHGANMMGYTPVLGPQVKFVLLGGQVIGTNTLLRWYVLHVLLLPFVTVIFMAIHFWRVRKDGGISGPL
jgi:quinol-cytochrome oxidoreductase complex cytochrome b subunit